MKRLIHQNLSQLVLKVLVPLLLILASYCVSSAHPPPSQTGIVLRVRLENGSIERLHVPNDAINSISLQDALQSLSTSTNNDDDYSIQCGSTTLDRFKTLADLGLKHGSLVSLVSSTNAAKDHHKLSTKKTKYFVPQSDSNRFDPFPELAKNYETAVYRKRLTRRTGSLSYADLANIQSELHTVEPQKAGPILRVYMCQTSAERFQAAAAAANSAAAGRAAILLGTFARERVDLNKPQRHRTSLSSTPTEDEYCTVAKVHATWEPRSSSSSIPTQGYDAEAVQNYYKDVKAMQVANWLGLEPVGWIFTYQDDRQPQQSTKNQPSAGSNEDALPVYIPDVITGAALQIDNMKQKKQNREQQLESARFVTLAMDEKTGATEAFQLSDVSVQMVAENMILPPHSNTNSRYGSTKHGILVDGKETTQLDSVLCLVNTAMLSHEGMFAGPPKVGSTMNKKNGFLTKKARKALLKVLSSDDSSKQDNSNTSNIKNPLLEELCNFHTILALYNEGLDSGDCERLCQLVRKWARGQKKGTVVDDELKRRLKKLLDITNF